MRLYLALWLFICWLSGACQPPAPAPPVRGFAVPWSSPYRVDPARPHHLVNAEGQHLWLLNKTAWAYFACQDPQQVLDKARAQGVNVLRVALEGRPYYETLGYDLWPWGGSRAQPDWATFDEAYWQEVERRVRLAGENGIGLDLVLYFSLKPEAADTLTQRAYWDQAIRRLGPYANLLTWEIMNEYIANETFQDACGRYFQAHDPYDHPVCSSDGTTEDALWPHKAWMDLAIVHTCTGQQAPYDLADWYLGIARNTRQYAKPAWNNESGRERRHQNDDPVHRRKQGWLWTTAGAYWTWHSWEGCEGIDDAAYYGPGWEALRPMADFFRGLPFAELVPNYTALIAEGPNLVQTALATPDRRLALLYLCTRETGRAVPEASLRVRLPDGRYRLHYLDPLTLRSLGTDTLLSPSLRQQQRLLLPAFTDDLLVRLELIEAEAKSLIEGTQ